MSVPAEGVQGAVAGALQVQQNVTTADNFQGLWDNGAFETPPPKGAKEPAQPQRQAKPAEPRQAKPEPKAVEPPAAEAPQSDASALNDAADAEQPPEEGDEPETPASEEKVYASLEAFAKEHEVDFESLKSLGVETKVDGETKIVPLRDVIKSFQLESHVNNKSIEYSDKLRALENEKVEVRTALVQQIHQTKALFEDARAQLLGDYNQVDWNTLRVQNPGEFAALSTQYQQRLNQIDQRLVQVSQAQEAEKTRQAQEAAKLLPQQREKMLDAAPEWRDPAKFEADRKVILDYGKQLGFSDAELGNINDYRYMLILRDAARGRALQASKPEVLKKVRAAPAMVRPGARSDRDPKTVQRTQAQERLARNPRDPDAQAAVFEFLS
jgi:hypothetical protein